MLNRIQSRGLKRINIHAPPRDPGPDVNNARQTCRSQPRERNEVIGPGRHPGHTPNCLGVVEGCRPWAKLPTNKQRAAVVVDSSRPRSITYRRNSPSTAGIHNRASEVSIASARRMTRLGASMKIQTVDSSSLPYGANGVFGRASPYPTYSIAWTATVSTTGVSCSGQDIQGLSGSLPLLCRSSAYTEHLPANTCWCNLSRADVML